MQGIPHSHSVVAVGREPTEAERAEVTVLVARYRARRDSFDLSLIEDYAEAHPDSPYAPSLHFAIGLAAREMARYQDTLSHLEAAWRRFEGARSNLARAQADRVIAELAVMHAQLGHRETLRTLFASLRTRPPLGVSAERINHAWEGYQMMEHDPGRAYLCGPLALRSVWRASHDNRTDLDPRIAAVRSTHQGTSVAQLAALASAVGMDLRAVRHPVGAPWASPMVIHWKVGHFAAIIDHRALGAGRGVYLLRDPTFGEDRWTTGDILDREASGITLAPANDGRTAAWAAVSDEEARSTWGRGYTTSGGAPNLWGREHRMKECGAGGSKGMPRRYLITHLATLAVEDTPIWNNPAFGDPLEFQLSYNQADWQGTPTWMSTLGQRWMHNWRGEIEVVTTTTWRHVPPTNLGPSPPTATQATSIIIHSRTGGDIHYRVPWEDEYESLPDVIDYESNARLVFHYDTGHNILSIDREFADHTSETYTGSAGHYRLTEVRDAQGRATTLTYRTGTARLESVTAPSGTMVFHYDTDDTEAETFLLIRSVSIGDRQATFTYAHVPGEATGDGGVGPEGPLMLTGITDMGGITSTFEYGSAARGLDPNEVGDPLQTTSLPDPTFLHAMTTPYGRTEFRTGWGLEGTDGGSPGRPIHRRRWLDVLYPGGERERLARHDIDNGHCPPSSTDFCFPDDTPVPPTYMAALMETAALMGLPGSYWGYPVAGYSNSRNTFYWSTAAYRRARARNPASTGEPEDWDLSIRDAHAYHWLSAPFDPYRSSSLLESEQAAGEVRVFYSYKSQTRPGYIDRFGYNMLYEPVARVTGIHRQVWTTGTTDHQDRTTRMTYNGEGLLESVTDDEGQKLVYTYNTAGDVTCVVREVAAGVQELLSAVTYNPSHPHLPMTLRDGTNQVTAFEYNSHHQLTEITRPDTSTVTYGYDGTTHRLTSVTSPAGTSATTYNGRGLPATTTSIEGITRSFTYDDLDRVLTITAPGSRTVTFDYRYRDEDGALALDTGGNPFVALEATSVTGIDGNISIRSYDALHRLRYSTTSGGSDPTRYRYDVVDGDWFHRVEMRRASGGSTVPTTQWSFPLNPMVTSYSTRPTRLRRGVSGAYEDTLYTYHPAGELASVTEPGATTPTLFEYDEVGRMTRACHNSGCSERDEVTYDVLRGRVTTTEAVNASGSVARVYSYGTTTQVQDPMQTATLPNADRVVELEELTHTGMTLTDSNETTYGYDVLGRLAQTVHGGETLGYEYDAAGRFTGIINNATTPVTPVLTHEYTSSVTSRRPSYSHLPRTNCVQDFLYQSSSDDHRMFSSWFFNASTWQTLAKIDLTFTSDGRLNSEQSERDWRYLYYNAARRLEFHSEYVNHGSGTYDLESGNETYFDAWGNPTTMNRYQDWGTGWSWSLLEGRTFSLSDRLLTRAMGPSASPTHTLSHDARGRVTGDGEFTYGWDAHDRLTTVTRVSDSQSWTFGYDASGRLTSMVEGAETVRLRWRGAALLGERIEASGSTTIERTYRPDGMEQSGAHLALVRDVRGSVIGLATGGARVRTYRYGVWGEQTVVAPGSGGAAYDTHLGFTGHVVHRPTGLVFAPARVYSPRLRQWLTRDPLGERDTIDGRNLYAYVAGDPVNQIDPTGEFPIPAVIAGGAIAFGIGLAVGHWFGQSGYGWFGLNSHPPSGPYQETSNLINERLRMADGNVHEALLLIAAQRGDPDRLPLEVANGEAYAGADHYLQGRDLVSFVPVVGTLAFPVALSISAGYDWKKRLMGVDSTSSRLPSPPTPYAAWWTIQGVWDGMGSLIGAPSNFRNRGLGAHFSQCAH